MCVRLRIVTRGGVDDLSRVVGVLALYELTPARLAVEAQGQGLRVEAIFAAAAPSGALCAARLARLPAIASVSWDVPPAS